MAKYSSSKSAKPTNSKVNGKGYAGASYKDRNLAGMSPDAAQELLKPTEAEPVSLQKRMAGCS